MEAEPKATGKKPQEQVWNSLLPVGRDTRMYRVSIHAVLWNKILNLVSFLNQYYFFESLNENTKL
jgi:hypothetical protein